MNFETKGNRNTKTISITSGKGGVGKTSLTANLAFCLAKKGKRILILDGDLGMSNVDIFFGVKSKENLLSVLTGEKEIHEVINPLCPQIDLLSGGSGLSDFNRMNPLNRRALLDSVSNLNHQYDYCLIDTGPGIADNVLYLNAAAQISLVIINNDPASLTDSYALIKVLNTEYKENKFAIVCNQVKDSFEGFNLYNHFSEVAHRFLYLSLDYWGFIPQDPLYRKSTQNQRLILKHEPTAISAQAIMNISDHLEENLNHLPKKTGFQFFSDPFIGVA